MSSADFLLGFLCLCLAVSSVHKGVVSRVSVVQLSTVHPATAAVIQVAGLLEAPEFKRYVQCVCNAHPVKVQCHMTIM